MNKCIECDAPTKEDFCASCLAHAKRALEPFLRQLDEFREYAWEKRCKYPDSDSPVKLNKSIVDYVLSERAKFRLNFCQERDGQWYGHVSVTINTPHAWKPFLLGALWKICGQQRVPPKEGERAVHFIWPVKAVPQERLPN